MFWSGGRRCYITDTARAVFTFSTATLPAVCCRSHL